MLFNKRKKKSMLVFNLVLLFFLVICSLAFVRLFVAYRYAQNRYEKVIENQEQNIAQKNKLEKQLKNLTTAEGVEYYVREQYRAVSAGERLVVLVDSKPIDTPVPAAPKKWWQSLFK